MTHGNAALKSLDTQEALQTAERLTRVKEQGERASDSRVNRWRSRSDRRCNRRPDHEMRTADLPMASYLQKPYSPPHLGRRPRGVLDEGNKAQPTGYILWPGYGASTSLYC